MRFVRSYKRRGGLVVTAGIPFSSRAHRSLFTRGSSGFYNITRQ